VSAARSIVGRALGSWWVRLALSIAILAYLASWIDMAAAARAVLAIDPRHLTLVLALVAVDRAVMILRWILLLRASDAPIAAAEAARIFLVSSFVGSFLPAGIGGDAARAYGLSRVTAAGDEALASVVVDRLLGVLSLVTMAIVGVIAWSPGGGVDARMALAVAFTILVCVAAFWADRIVDALAPASGSFVFDVGRAISRYRGHRGALTHVMAWSIAVQVLRITQAYLLGLGLGMTVPFRYYLLFMPLGLLMLLLPVSVSGFGLPQGVMVWLLRPMGVADEQSLALSTLIVLTGLAGNLPGLVLWLRQRREIL
jgi:uncharacterized membrane protein YbhN (UPF0104 family)